VEVCRVDVDDELGGRLAAEHLWSLGHRELAALHLWHGSWALNRARGFLSRLEALGQPAVADITLDEPAEDCVAAVLARLMRAPAPPTALFCDADWLAAHAVRILREMGLRVPEDVSIVGFDDAHYCTLVSPALTTIRQPYDGMAAIAVQLLLEQVAMARPFVRSFILPCELVVRASTAQCRNGGE
jgi:LacI family transcriptional regulator